MAQESLNRQEWIRPRIAGAFSCYDTTMIQEIIKRLDEISANKDKKPLDIIGGYIVGATIVRDDIEELYKQYPQLETIAELGAELETLEGSIHAASVFKEFQNALIHFKEVLKDDASRLE